MSHPRDDKDQDCFCEDPYRAGKKLMLCGKAICIRLLDKKLPYPKLIIAVEDDVKD